ncbi:hypothetical protein [Methanobrevibacter gottschalkii]|nr:hypothetical protein [Methanobrevibacter gottschalkii]
MLNSVASLCGDSIMTPNTAARTTMTTINPMTIILFFSIISPLL